MFPYIIAFLIGVGITLIGSFFYVRGLTARHESDLSMAHYQGRVSRDIEIEEMFGLR